MLVSVNDYIEQQKVMSIISKEHNVNQKISSEEPQCGIPQLAKALCHSFSYAIICYFIFLLCA